MADKKKGFFKIFAKNLKKSLGPGQYQTNGIKVTCVHCQYDRFEYGRAQLNSTLMTFLKLDFTDPSASILTCGRCGYIHWFNKKIYRID